MLTFMLHNFNKTIRNANKLSRLIDHSTSDEPPVGLSLTRNPVTSDRYNPQIRTFVEVTPWGQGPLPRSFWFCASLSLQFETDVSGNSEPKTQT